MPDRIVRANILTSARIDALGAGDTETFYRRLMSVVDDFGRFDGRVSLIKAACYPLRLDCTREADIARWITKCEKAGLIALYTVDAKPYLELLNLGDRRRAKYSKYPPPPPATPPPKADADVCQHVPADVGMCQHVRPDADAHSDAHSDADAHANPPAPTDAPAPPQPAAPVPGAGGWKLPAVLDCPEFRAAWTLWKDHLRKKRVRTTSMADEHQIAKCVAWGVEQSVANIRHSIAGNYQGLYPDKNWSSQHGHRKPTAAERGEFPEFRRALPE